MPPSATRVAGVAPGGGAQDQHFHVVLAQRQRAVEVGNGARPRLHGGVTQAAVDPQVGVVGLELERAALRRRSLVGLPRLHPGLAGLRRSRGIQ